VNTVFHTAAKKIMSLQSPKSLEKTLDSSVFIRVHRSFFIKQGYGLKSRDLFLVHTNSVVIVMKWLRKKICLDDLISQRFRVIIYYSFTESSIFLCFCETAFSQLF
jgi:hypothetical protein